MATNLAAIVDKTRQLDERIAEIAQSSHEQSEGIAQINNAVASMDKITQGNAALAQQSAASSEELKAQAEQVRLGVAELMRMTQGTDVQATVATGVEPKTPKLVKRAAAPAGNGNGHAPQPVVAAASNGHGEGNGNGHGHRVASDFKAPHRAQKDLFFEDQS
jgi:methyl-accepting chemotaxis protein